MCLCMNCMYVTYIGVMYVCMYVFMYVRMCMYVCMFVCMFVCTYVCMYICIYGIYVDNVRMLNAVQCHTSPRVTLWHTVCLTWCLPVGHWQPLVSALKLWRQLRHQSRGYSRCRLGCSVWVCGLLKHPSGASQAVEGRREAKVRGFSLIFMVKWNSNEIYSQQWLNNWSYYLIKYFEPSIVKFWNSVAGRTFGWPFYFTISSSLFWFPRA